MFEIISIFCIIVAVGLLIALSIIDLKILILPDELNFSLAIFGIAFHFFATQQILRYEDMIYGALIGGGMLYIIRFFSNRYYGRDTLGLGDVKLLAAAGVWLGPDYITIAITLGALAGLIHGLAVAALSSKKSGQDFSLHSLSIPAGPGFAVGIILAGAYAFTPYIGQIIHDFTA